MPKKTIILVSSHVISLPYFLLASWMSTSFWYPSTQSIFPVVWAYVPFSKVFNTLALSSILYAAFFCNTFLKFLISQFDCFIKQINSK
jgi:hypothetical protein